MTTYVASQGEDDGTVLYPLILYDNMAIFNVNLLSFKFYGVIYF